MKRRVGKLTGIEPLEASGDRDVLVGKIQGINLEVIIAVGRGIKSKDNLVLAEKLAEVLGGDLAASRRFAGLPCT